MKKFLFSILLLTGGLSVLNSCTKRIDIHLDETYVRLTVEGYILPDERKNYIRLTKTGDYFSNEPNPAVSDAVVQVDDKEGTYILKEDSIHPGYYFFPPNFRGKEKETYSLDVELPEKIGGYNHYQSSAYLPEMTMHIDSIAIQLNPVFDFWMILIYAPKPPGKNYYLIKRMTNDTLVTSNINDMNVFDDGLLDNDYFHGLAVMGIDKDDIQPGDKITLLVSLITEDYYNFIKEAQTELQPHDPMFSGPPANVRSNVDHGASGYFTAYASTSSSTYFKGE